MDFPEGIGGTVEWFWCVKEVFVGLNYWSNR